MSQEETQINIDPVLRGLDNISVLSDEMHFKVLMVTGGVGEQYLVSPMHTKQIYLLFKKEIEEYEKKFGEIKTN
ncbi:MAG: hypothetical protein U9R00_02195 [Patescibacteria group bacterium]|nr:hypothetical protein [Patescibacteria group bacterium]